MTPVLLKTSYNIPSYTQVATPELVSAVLDGGLSPAEDDGWRDYGAADPQEYAWWITRSCGMVCVKMVVEALGGPVRPVMDWVHRGVDRGGYVTRTNLQGEKVEIGWLHQTLVDLIKAEGFSASASEVPVDHYARWLSEDKIIIASVSYEIGTRQDITRRGGHLVVITGVEVEKDQVKTILVNNPSGRSPELRQHASIPYSRMKIAVSGRGIIVGK